ncbi:MAG: SDR family oxidoreductase [Flammeovirgaceae bacterium]|nr:SDR family oxidoreductase [Flammeovirgaceae bacterium]
MTGKVAIITGGSSGIGKALAEEFGSKGAKIVITGRNIESLENTVTALKQKNIDLIWVKADVSIEEDNLVMVNKTIEKYGKIDILINNAGISMRALFEDLNLDIIRKVMDINFFGTVNATKYCLPEIIKNKGSIIGISSIAGFRGLPGRVGYSASKFAMQGFLEALRTELLYKGVHVLTACPGFTASNIRKKSLTNDGSHQGESPRNEQKMMTAEECAKHIYKATKKRKKFLILTPIGKITVFLNKFFPGFMDKMTYNALAKEPDSPFSNSKN